MPHTLIGVPEALPEGTSSVVGAETVVGGEVAGGEVVAGGTVLLPGAVVPGAPAWPGPVVLGAVVGAAVVGAAVVGDEVVAVLEFPGGTGGTIVEAVVGGTATAEVAVLGTLVVLTWQVCCCMHWSIARRALFEALTGFGACNIASLSLLRPSPVAAKPEGRCCPERMTLGEPAKRILGDAPTVGARSSAGGKPKHAVAAAANKTMGKDFLRAQRWRGSACTGPRGFACAAACSRILGFE
ncbi:MAG TPA: hypothetical protein VK425_02450 [Acidimicrobiales bacterium]|nr:hypothetical protein [Acidimicrobiales bacterium]